MWQASPTPSRRSTETSIVHSDADSFLATYDNVLIGVLRGPGAYLSLEPSRALHAALRERYPQGFCKLAISTMAAPMPNAAQRHIIAGIADEFDRNTLAAGLIFEGSRLFVTAMRSLSSALFSVSRSPVEQRAFGAVSDACAWLETRSGGEPTLDARGLAAFIVNLRRSAP